MPGFQRRARWLNALFPASEKPAVQDPGDRSADVSLTQPYDGGGWGFPVEVLRSDILTGVTDFFIFLETGEDEIFRLLFADVVLLVDAGPAPNTKMFLQVFTPNLSGNLCAPRFSHSATPLNAGELIEFGGQPTAPIIGPGSQLRVDMVANVVGSTWTVGVYGCLAPLGTSFTV